ncbi:hypothetical protein V2H45_19695 [Tumidithrix elongata RA019]|uniref:Uncharacterized protein n=1 Tax=Tumidithrix elongata BACA0141 TaxID=2716417 RepID=A0AAW9Q6X6_9CYAN|nr:hypothetical protein [Tumidithrix elongata RA019]
MEQNVIQLLLRVLQTDNPQQAVMGLLPENRQSGFKLLPKHRDRNL